MGKRWTTTVLLETWHVWKSTFIVKQSMKSKRPLDLYTDDIVWDAPALNGLDRSFSGKQDVTKNYYELFASMRNVHFQCLQRFATEDRVVDDSMVTFEIARGGYWPWPVDAKIEMRLVHIFEMRDGKISRELVFDMGRPVR
jgi:ketosteroid isomerase-like protein